MKQAKRRRSWWSWLLIGLLFAVSLVLIFNQQIKYYLVGSYQPRITRATVAKNDRQKGSFDFASVQDLNLQGVAKARANKESVPVIGAIAVPAVNLRVPIAKGVSNSTLSLAAGTMRPDQKMGVGNYPLAAHNMANGSKILFTPLFYHGKVGQMVYLTDMQRVYEYRIYERKFIAATQVEVVNNTPENIVTLVTCDATGAGRLMFRGHFIKSVPFDRAPVSIQKDLSGRYTNGQK